jgi:ADP-heptose:LPS heptosyltransferase
MMVASPTSVLVIRTDKIGDLILSTPAIASVRRSAPAARLTLLVSPYNRPVVEGWSVPDAVVSYDRGWPLSRRLALVRELRDLRIDLCLVLHADVESYVVARTTGAQRRVGLVNSRRPLDRIAAGILLTDSTTIDIERAASGPEQHLHETDLTRAVVEHAGLAWSDEPLMRPQIPPDSAAVVDTAVRALGGATGVIALHLSDKWLTHGWTFGDMLQLLGRLAVLDGAPVVLATVGPGDVEMAREVARHASCEAMPDMPVAGMRLVASGRVVRSRAAILPVDYGLWAAVFARASVVITHDTGAVHLAASLGRSLVAVYFPERAEINMRQFRPWRVWSRCLLHEAPESTTANILTAVVDASDVGRWNATAGTQRERPFGL